MNLQLRFINGPEQGRSIEIPLGVLTIGRSSEADVVVYWDGQVSSRHLQIVREPEQCQLIDVGSRNGTRVNQQTIQSVFLQAGDEIQLGETRLCVVTHDHTGKSDGLASAGNAPTTDWAAERSPSSPIEGSISNFTPVPIGVDTAQPPLRSERPNRDNSSQKGPVTNPFTSIDNLESIQWNEQSSSQAAWPQPFWAERDSASSSRARSSTSADEHQATYVPQPSDGPPSIHRVCLQVTSGTLDGQQTSLHWLSPGQVLSVGRSFNCDCCVPDDFNLADRHFLVECTNEACNVIDLQTETGTWVNGERITKAELFDKDSLVAGRTEFQVEVETMGGLLLRGQRPLANEASEPAMATAPPRTPSPGWVLHARQVACNQSTFSIAGKFAEEQSAELFLLGLRGLGQIYLLLDFVRFQESFPPTLDVDQSKLFAWLPTVAASRSVHLFASDELSGHPEIVEDAWGNDAVSILISSMDKAELLAGLRDLLQDPNRDGDQVDGIMGFCWPSVVRVMLTQDVSEFAQNYFQCVHCLVTEGKQSQEWQLFVADTTIGTRLLQKLAQAGVHIEIDPSENVAEATAAPALHEGNV